MSGGYDLLIGRGKALLADAGRITNAALGGWRMAGILMLQGGQPLTIGCNLAPSASFGCNAVLVPGRDVNGGLHNINQWLNPLAFHNPAAATAVGQADLSAAGWRADAGLSAPGSIDWIGRCSRSFRYRRGARWNSRRSFSI